MSHVITIEKPPPSCVPSLAELCFHSIAENLEYNSEIIKLLPTDVTERLIAFMVDRLHPIHLLMTQTRSIKINLIRQKRSCTFRFLLHGSVSQAIQQIYEKTETDNSGFSVESYGLFQPAGAFRRARWLHQDKLLSYYDIDTSDTLEFKTKDTTIKIKFLGPWERVVHPLHLPTVDKTVKTFIVDESKTVVEIARHIANKLGLPNYDEISLKLLGEDDEVGMWCVPDLSLPEQGIDPIHSIFLLKRQYYFTDERVSTSVDPTTLHYIFCQCLDAIVAMTHPCSVDEAVIFAALQCQIAFGDYDQNNTALNAFTLKEYLPIEYVSQKGIERDIMNTYMTLSGMTEEKAKVGYIQLTKSLKSYLYTFFRVEKLLNKNTTQTCLLGISADTVLIIDASTRQTVDRHPFSSICKWQVLHSFFSLYLEGNKEEYLTAEAETISQCLFTHLHRSLRHAPGLQKRMEDCYDAVARSYGRRRASTTTSIDSNESSELAAIVSSAATDDPAMRVRRCPLYVEPKRVYINLLFGNTLLKDVPYGNLSAPKLEEIVKLNKFVKLLRMLSKLSNKMMGSISHKDVQEQTIQIRVRFSDRKEKHFLVHENKLVREVAMEVGRILGIKNADEFSFQAPPPTPSRHSGSFSSSSVNNSALYGDDDALSEGCLWLNPNKTIKEQGIGNNGVVQYKKKFYYHYDNSEDCNNDPLYFNLLFCQSRDAIISNVYSCSREEAIQLAATLFQINFGDHNPNIHKPGFLKPQDLRFFLPTECLEAWGMPFQKVENMIYKEHRLLRGIKEAYAKFRYVQLCRSLKTFGAIFFHVKQTKTSHPMLSQAAQNLLIGFSRKCILILTAKTKKFLNEIPLTHLRRWGYNDRTNIFTFDFGDYEEGCICVFTYEGVAIMQYLADYVEFIQTKMLGSQALLASGSYPCRTSSENKT
eukprot:TRINITY_DN3335_c0_g1_i1.p1 TRINITY_DN3335_c0_g1~~TRINITY_DN3335_c0_g1_i1.p1  ORF type:complete len:927 (+),score=207.74 TRINITY_DN3335_c0_g1_i1:192-2972(+)